MSVQSHFLRFSQSRLFRVRDRLFGHQEVSPKTEAPHISQYRTFIVSKDTSLFVSEKPLLYDPESKEAEDRPEIVNKEERSQKVQKRRKKGMFKAGAAKFDANNNGSLSKEEVMSYVENHANLYAMLAAFLSLSEEACRDKCRKYGFPFGAGQKVA